MSSYTPEEFERLSGELFNERIGDFLYIHAHHGANPEWLHYWDILGNQVMHGGRGCQTDVYVRIKSESRQKLLPLLYKYINHLLARHGEKLQGEGLITFDNVISIWLPSKVFSVEGDVEVRFHTGSGVYYDQDEIAQEIMAALSQIPVLKALAPSGSYYGFVRKDFVGDSEPVRFEHETLPIFLTFGFSEELQPVVVVLDSADENMIEMFKEVMFSELADYVRAKAEKPLVRQLGLVRCVNEDTKVVTEMTVSQGKVTLFSVSAPYRDWIAFNRLDCAKRIMNALYENLVRSTSEEKQTL